MPRWARFVVPAVVVVALLAVLASDSDDRTTLTASDQPSTTTTEPTTTTTTPTTTTTEPTTTTTAPPPTTAPPTTAPPTTAPPPTTTVPAGPTEFQATVRGHDQGPDYYGIFYGTTYGASGGFKVTATCRPGTVRVTVLEDGWTDPPAGNTAYPTRVWIYADGNELAYNKNVSDGTVISGPVSSQVFIQTSGPSEHDMRIQYDCRG